MRIDVTASSVPQNYPRDYCPDNPCVPLFATGRNFTWTRITTELKQRFIIVDVKGETVLINISTEADDCDEFLPVRRSCWTLWSGRKAGRRYYGTGPKYEHRLETQRSRGGWESSRP